MEWITRLMEALGSPGAGLAVALENVFPPVPSEVILPLAGFTAGQGKISLIAAILWTTVGSVAGALVLYGLGAWLGLERLRKVADRIPFVTVSDVDKSDAWFDRHGSKAVFFGRMVPVVRSLISIPAGVSGMPVLKFTLYTAAGSLVWNTALILAGYALGDNYELVDRYLGWVSTVVLAALAIAIVWFVVSRVKARRS
ncbi:membrane protein DedA, SNARE-associated domain [Lentzea albidocapillata subsp. violacea]|uniref:Membrane protein DedA, SNARE-associated domain n=1 Tax=Lentzea albidocapillata subsp. violacea TaxID=128104 RepID=A0A1G9XLW2_9PSEU|nr:DedA family protein [Lentzea albidocapillata]SDM97243.1 membrane protein DedA, SNARE-associated domain [Lentzea albidocapillata subsp. violacea]